MPASEEPYRRQSTLHLVFAIFSVAMLLSTVWMVMADHMRPWKEVQRGFQEVERDKLKVAADEKEKLLGYVDELTKEKERLTREVDRAKRLIEQKDAQYFGLLAWFRSLPLMDFAAPPAKIQQISLPDLTINYNFKEVPRYDRC